MIVHHARNVFIGILCCVSTIAADAAVIETSKNACPEDWAESHKGNCWIETPLFTEKPQWAYVHPNGWVVDGRCFTDSRLANDPIISALTAAWRKLDPNTPIANGGCLSEFNPEWGRELTDLIWQKHTMVSCPPISPSDTACADHHARERYYTDAQGRFSEAPDYYHIISLRNSNQCLAKGGSGMPGVLFHETLHAAGADNLPTERHNNVWERQDVFARDAVYGAEAVCFFGIRPEFRRFVNFLQCKNTVSHDAAQPRLDLCDAFDASFTDQPPPGFIKH